MKIEEMAKKWAENHPQYKKLSTENQKRSKKEVEDCIRFTLTSLLEELPEVDKLPNNHNGVDIGVRLGAIDYRNEIKSLIKNKLK